MGLRPAAPSHGCRRSRPRPGPAALDRARDANGGPLPAAPLPLPSRPTAAPNTDIRYAAEMNALSLPVTIATTSRKLTSFWLDSLRDNRQAGRAPRSMSAYLQI